MIKIGDNEIAEIPGSWPEKEFFPFCEAFAIDHFHNKGELPPFSMFWIHNKMLLANWNFQDVDGKNIAMGQAKFICKLLGVTKYFFASEVWMKAIPADDPDLNTKVKKINKNGVESEPDRIEQLMFIMESKGQKPLSIHYDIIRKENNMKLGDRTVINIHGTGRAIGILD